MTHYSRKKTYWRDKCDSLFSEIIKLKAGGKCEETNKTERLQCAHIISRSYYSTRWDTDNAVCLLFKRHKYYTHHLVEWRKYIREYKGEGYYDEMEKRALHYKQRTLLDYKELYGQLETLRDTFKRWDGELQIRDNPGRTKY